MLRNFKPSDVDSIMRINEQQDFRLKDRSGCITDAVIEEKNKVVAYGIVRCLAEAIVLVDIEAPKISRMKAIRELMRQAIFGTANKGIPQLHVFVSDPALSELLKKHFGFVQTKDIVLVKNL